MCGENTDLELEIMFAVEVLHKAVHLGALGVGVLPVCRWRRGLAHRGSSRREIVSKHTTASEAPTPLPVLGSPSRSPVWMYFFESKQALSVFLKLQELLQGAGFNSVLI